MLPDGYLQPPRRDALKSPRFPILTFDEWQLRLALGSFFKIEWLMPGESLVSILWKFARANALPGQVLLELIRSEVCEGVVPLRNAFDLTQLGRLIRLPRNVLTKSLLDVTRGQRYVEAFRYCRHCAAHGYHSVLHQLTEEHSCPAHQQSLETRCLECLHEMPFIVSSRVIDAPFRCVWCGSHFGYGRLSSLSTTPAMRKKDITAIRHRVQLRLRSDVGQR